MISKILRLRWPLRHIWRRVRYQWFSPHKLVAVRTMNATEYTDIVELLPEAVFTLFINFVENELGFREKTKDNTIEEATILALELEIEQYNDVEHKEKTAGEVYVSAWKNAYIEMLDIYKLLKNREYNHENFMIKDSQVTDTILIRICKIRRFLWT